MKITRILAAACFALLSTNAFASKCYIKEYASLGIGAASGGATAQVAQEPALVDQGAIDFTSGHIESAAFNALTRFIRVWCDAQASFQVGATPTATNTMSPFTASSPEFLGVQAGHKISVVANP